MTGTLATMTRDDLLVLRDQLSGESARIKAQLEEAKANVRVGGGYSDPDWFRRANAAQRIIGGKIQKVQSRIAALNSERKAKNIAEKSHVVKSDHLGFLHAFYRVAKVSLESVDFQEMCDEAIALKVDLVCERCSGSAP